MKKFGIALIIILLLVGSAVVIKEVYLSDPQPKTKISEQSAQQKRDEDTSTQLEEATITLFSQDGATKWELKAATIQQFENSSQVALKEVSARVYKEGTQVVSLTAAQGTADMKTGFLTFKGPIRIESKGRVVKADRLNWNQAKDQLIGRGNVVLKKPGLTMTGDNFIARMDLRKIRVKGNAQAIYNKAGDQNE